MSYFNVMNQTPANNYMYLANTARGTSLMEIGSSQTIFVDDAGKKNALVFKMYNIPVSEHALVCEMCLSIARMANGNVRNLVEDSRVLLLMKQYGLDEIYHTSYGLSGLTTLWTPQDAEALMS